MTPDFLVPELLLTQTDGRMTVVDISDDPAAFPEPTYANLADNAAAVASLLVPFDSMLLTAALLGWEARYIDIFPLNQPVPLRLRFHLDESLLLETDGELRWHLPVSRTALDAPATRYWFVAMDRHPRIDINAAVPLLDSSALGDGIVDIGDALVDLLADRMGWITSVSQDRLGTGLLGALGAGRWHTDSALIDERLVPAFRSLESAIDAIAAGTIDERRDFLYGELLPRTPAAEILGANGEPLERVRVPERVREFADVDPELPTPRAWKADWVNELIATIEADIADAGGAQTVRRPIVSSSFRRLSLTASILYLHNLGVVDVIADLGFTGLEHLDVDDRTERFKTELIARTDASITLLEDQWQRTVTLGESGRSTKAFVPQLLAAHLLDPATGISAALGSVGVTDIPSIATGFGDEFDALLSRLRASDVFAAAIDRIERAAAQARASGAVAPDVALARGAMTILGLEAAGADGLLPASSLSTSSGTAPPTLPALADLDDELTSRIDAMRDYRALVLAIDTDRPGTMYPAIHPVAEHAESRNYLLGELLLLPSELFSLMQQYLPPAGYDALNPPTGTPLEVLDGPEWTIAAALWADRERVLANDTVTSILQTGASIAISIGVSALSLNPIAGVAAGMATAAAFGAYDYYQALGDLELAAGMESVGDINGVSLGSSEWTRHQRYELEQAIQSATVNVLLAGVTGGAGAIAGKISSPIVATMANLAIDGFDGLASAWFDGRLSDGQYLTERDELDGYLPPPPPTAGGEVFRSVAMSVLFSAAFSTGTTVAGMRVDTEGDRTRVWLTTSAGDVDVADHNVVAVQDAATSQVSLHWNDADGPQLTTAEAASIDLAMAASVTSTGAVPERQAIRNQAVTDHTPPPPPPPPPPAAGVISPADLAANYAERGTMQVAYVPRDGRSATWTGEREARLRFGTAADTELPGTHRWRFGRNGQLTIVRVSQYDPVTGDKVPEKHFRWTAGGLEIIDKPPRLDHHSAERRAWRQSVFDALNDPGHPMHPLREIFIDTDTDKFVTREGRRAHYELISFPEIFDAGHIDSYATGGDPIFMIQSAYVNQAQYAPYEGSGAGFSHTYIEALGFRWDWQTARDLCLKFRTDEHRFVEFGDARPDLEAALEPLRRIVFPDPEGLPNY